MVRFYANVGEKEGILKERLLFIVEDDPLIRKGLGLILSRIEGVRVHAYECPGDLLNALEEGQEPDLVFTDNDMPGMTGTELVRHLRGRGFTASIVMYSGSDKAKRDPELRNLLDAYLSKPAANDEIVSAVRAALDRPVA